MFKVGDKVKLINSSWVKDDDEFNVIWFNDGLYKLEHSEVYIVENISNGHREYVNGEDMLTIDKTYFRRKKLKKICSKLVKK